MNELAERIEIYLLTKREWVSAYALCLNFGVSERELRAKGKKPGLCTAFAISGDKGFRHVRNATEEEFNRFVGRIRTHGIAELVRVKRLRLARKNAITERPPFEKFTGQSLFKI